MSDDNAAKTVERPRTELPRNERRKQSSDSGPGSVAPEHRLKAVLDAAPDDATIVVCNASQLTEARDYLRKQKRHLGVVLREHQEHPKWVITK